MEFYSTKIPSSQVKVNAWINSNFKWMMPFFCCYCPWRLNLATQIKPGQIKSITASNTKRPTHTFTQNMNNNNNNTEKRMKIKKKLCERNSLIRIIWITITIAITFQISSKRMRHKRFRINYYQYLFVCVYVESSNRRNVDPKRNNSEEEEAQKKKGKRNTNTRKYRSCYCLPHFCWLTDLSIPGFTLMPFTSWFGSLAAFVLLLLLLNWLRLRLLPLLQQQQKKTLG